jgi:hypothetical protein
LKLRTLQETAKILGLNEATLRSAANDKRLPATKSGGTWLVDLDDPLVQKYQANLSPRQRRKTLPKPTKPKESGPPPLAWGVYRPVPNSGPPPPLQWEKVVGVEERTQHRAWVNGVLLITLQAVGEKPSSWQIEIVGGLPGHILYQENHAGSLNEAKNKALEEASIILQNALTSLGIHQAKKTLVQ